MKRKKATIADRSGRAGLFLVLCLTLISSTEAGKTGSPFDFGIRVPVKVTDFVIFKELDPTQV